MRMTPRPTQFDSGLSFRSAATPTCSSCCCCCCCVATILATPIVNGGIGAKLAATRGMPREPAKLAATTAPIIGMVTAVAIGVLTGAIEGLLGQTWAWLWIAPGVAALVATYFALSWAADLAGRPGVALGWTAGLAGVFGVAFVAEVIAGGAIILSGAYWLYPLLPVVAIYAAVIWRKFLLKSGEAEPVLWSPYSDWARDASPRDEPPPEN